MTTLPVTSSFWAEAMGARVNSINRHSINADGFFLSLIHI